MPLFARTLSLCWPCRPWMHCPRFGLIRFGLGQGLAGGGAGRVEPMSGLIRIAAPVMGIVDEVLAEANETVFAGQPLIKLARSGGPRAT